MQSVLDQLKGRKTYLAALGLALLAAYHGLSGDYGGATNLALQALGLFGLRQAVEDAIKNQSGGQAK